MATTPSTQSHYEVLGLDQQATAEQVKAAYQRLVLTLHPDKAGQDSQEQFQLLQQAYQVPLPNTGWPAKQQHTVVHYPSCSCPGTTLVPA